LRVVEDDKLLVFISWSKHLAREVAIALKEYLELVFDPVVLPWMSDQDVELGSRSMAELGETLDRSSFGIIVVTKTNQNSQWINFEAGALSKKVGDPAVSVIPLLVDFDSPTDLTGPLAQFQAIVYGRENILRMMFVIAERAGVNRRTIKHRFDSHWPTFDDQVQLALKDYPAEASVRERDEEDKTDEMLAILRRLQSDQRLGRPVKTVPPPQTPQSLGRILRVWKRDGDSYRLAASGWTHKGDRIVFLDAFGNPVGRPIPADEVVSITRIDQDDEVGATRGPDDSPPNN
jgi:hypothetical protein